MGIDNWKEKRKEKENTCNGC